MKLQELLREENYHLKNEITDLKTAFDINRDILRLIAHHDNPADHEHRLLIQIITKLTAINNDALLANLQLAHDKAQLKEENLRINIELNDLHQRFARETKTNEQLRSSTSHSNNTELSPLQESAMKLEWAETNFASNNLLGKEECDKKGLKVDHDPLSLGEGNKRKRKYTEVESIQLEEQLRERSREVHRLQRYAEQLESRLLLFAKAYKLDQEPAELASSSMAKERLQSELIKYALQDIKVIRKNDQCVIRVSHRINKMPKTDSLPRSQNGSASYPKLAHLPLPSQRSLQSPVLS